MMAKNDVLAKTIVFQLRDLVMVYNRFEFSERFTLTGEYILPLLKNLAEYAYQSEAATKRVLSLRQWIKGHFVKTTRDGLVEIFEKIPHSVWCDLVKSDLRGSGVLLSELLQSKDDGLSLADKYLHVFDSASQKELVLVAKQLVSQPRIKSAQVAEKIAQYEELAAIVLAIAPFCDAQAISFVVRLANIVHGSFKVDLASGLAIMRAAGCSVPDLAYTGHEIASFLTRSSHEATIEVSPIPRELFTEDFIVPMLQSLTGKEILARDPGFVDALQALFKGGCIESAAMVIRSSLFEVIPSLLTKVLTAIALSGLQTGADLLVPALETNFPRFGTREIMYVVEHVPGHVLPALLQTLQLALKRDCLQRFNSGDIGAVYLEHVELLQYVSVALAAQSTPQFTPEKFNATYVAAEAGTIIFAGSACQSMPVFPTGMKLNEGNLSIGLSNGEVMNVPLPGMA